MSETTRYIDVDELPHRQRKYFKHFSSLYDWVLDGHSVRSAVWLGRLYALLGLTVGLVFKVVVFLIIAVVFNQRNLNDPRKSLHPFAWGENTGPLNWGTQSSRWTQDIFGRYYSRALKYYNPPIAVLLFFLAWGCADGTEIDAHWDFLDALMYVGPFLLMGLMIVYAMALVNLTRQHLKSHRRRT